MAEAVRIRRRGGEGAILNSKAEFNRCHIPRLQLEEEEPEGARKESEQELMKQMEEHNTIVIKGLPIPSEKLEKFVAWPGIEPGSSANMASALTTELPNRAR